MTGEQVCLLVLLVGGLAPALALACRGEPIARLVGVELVTSVLVFAFLILSQLGNAYELVVPLVLVPLAFAGTLVFTRLLREGPVDEG
ncbi:MAG: hypothetical protein JWM85_208 [Acidimicrobiaceae bacterium]|nr:hypothetical protein [Acidimicrobiaceae bacterium]